MCLTHPIINVLTIEFLIKNILLFSKTIAVISNNEQNTYTSVNSSSEVTGVKQSKRPIILKIDMSFHEN